MSSTICLELLNFHRATWPQELFRARFLVFGRHCFFTLTRENTSISAFDISKLLFVCWLASLFFFTVRPSTKFPLATASSFTAFFSSFRFLLFLLTYRVDTSHRVAFLCTFWHIHCPDELMLNNNFYFENFGFHKDNNFFFSLHRRPNYREMPCVMSSSYAKKNLVWTHNSQYGGRFGFVRSLRFCF